MPSKVCPDIKEKILKLHKEGYLTNEIAKITNLNCETVRRYLKRNDLVSNYWKRRKLKVNNGLGRCSVCGKWKDLNKFALRYRVRKSKKYNYQSRICSTCTNERNVEAKNATIRHYLSTLISGRKYFAKQKGISFNLTADDLFYIYNEQSGLCFYSGEKLEWKLGHGKNGPCAVSIDRVDVNYCYLPNNVVLCTKRMNTIKLDLTIDEMRIYTPHFYDKIINCNWLYPIRNNYYII